MSVRVCFELGGCTYSSRSDDYSCVFHLTTIDDYSDAKNIYYTTPIRRMRSANVWRSVAVCVCVGTGKVMVREGVE